MKRLKNSILGEGRINEDEALLLHAAFQLLTDFVEQEQPGSKKNGTRKINAICIV
jgi:hypothetical protein